MRFSEDKINKYHIIALLVIVLFGALRLIYFFSLRDGHHVDEAWSYGFANSYYDPYVYSDSRNGDVTDQSHWKHLYEWLPGEVFKEYITVSDNQRFTFDSVLYNKEFDLGPALYPLILHFFCSLFPNTFSWSFAFFINLTCFIFSLFFIFLISYEISGSSYVGIFSVFFYILSGCGTANYLYLRVYSLFTFFAIVLFYLFVKYIKGNNKNIFIIFVLMPFVTILGCMTHYYFLVIAFFLTFFSMIAVIIKKRFFDSLKLGFVMLFSVVLFFMIYSPAFQLLLPFFTKGSNVGGSSGGYSLSYSWNVSAANMHFFQGTIGFFIDFSFPLILSIIGVVVFALVFLALIAFLFRNEEWFKGLIKKLKANFIDFFYKAKKFFKTFDISLLVAVLSSVSFFLIIPRSVALSTMGYIERYLFAAMSLFIIAYLSIVGSLLFNVIKSKFNKWAKYIIVCALGACMLFLSARSNQFTNQFKFSGMNDKELASLLEGKSCYVLIHAVRDMVWLSPELEDTEEVYLDIANFINSDDHTIPYLDSDCLILLNATDFLSDEQKEQYEDDGNIELNGLLRPSVFMTTDDYIKMIEDQNGLNYSCINEFSTFIGDLKLYSATT